MHVLGNETDPPRPVVSAVYKRVLDVSDVVATVEVRFVCLPRQLLIPNIAIQRACSIRCDKTDINSPELLGQRQYTRLAILPIQQNLWHNA